MDAPHGYWLRTWRKYYTATPHECYKPNCTNPGSSIPRNSSYTVNLPPISKTIQIKRKRHAGHCWKSQGELMSDVPQWTPSHGWAGVGRPAKNHLQLLCTDTGYSLEDLPNTINDKVEWREGERESQENLCSRHDIMMMMMTICVCTNISYEPYVIQSIFLRQSITCRTLFEK